MNGSPIAGQPPKDDNVVSRRYRVEMHDGRTLFVYGRNIKEAVERIQDADVAVRDSVPAGLVRRINGREVIEFAEEAKLLADNAPAREARKIRRKKDIEVASEPMTNKKSYLP